MIFPSHREHLSALPRISVNGLYQKLRYFSPFISGLPTRLSTGMRPVSTFPDAVSGAFRRHPLNDHHCGHHPQNTAEHEIQHVGVPGGIGQGCACDGDCNQRVDNDQNNDQKHGRSSFWREGAMWCAFFVRMWINLGAGVVGFLKKDQRWGRGRRRCRCFCVLTLFTY